MSNCVVLVAGCWVKPQQDQVRVQGFIRHTWLIFIAKGIDITCSAVIIWLSGWPWIGSPL